MARRLAGERCEAAGPDLELRATRRGAAAGALAARASRGLLVLFLLSLALAPSAPAQQGGTIRPSDPLRSALPASTNGDSASSSLFRSRADSLEWVRARSAAYGAQGRRLIVSIQERRLWWMNGRDTLFSAPVATGTGERLETREGVWDFVTPRGMRRVIGKERNPVWVPPEWHYAELARDSAFGLVRLQRGRGISLNDGNRVVVRGERIGLVRPDGGYEELPADEEIIFGRTLFIPPYDTANRRIAGELGKYKLDLGNGILLHGTPHKDSIGRAATHGCIRLHDEDLEYLYRNVPVGTRVFIY